MLLDPGIQYVALPYGRASVDIRKKGRSVDAQLRDLRPLIDGYGWPIARELRDDDRSASAYANRTRDDYDLMVELVRDRVGLTSTQRHVIAAWEVSRISRDLESFMALRRAAQDTGALFLLDDELYDMRNPKHRKRLTQAVLEAESEADSIQARNSRTARHSAADGAPYGPLPYGYRREYDPDTGELIRQVLDERTRPIAREITYRVAAREPVKRIMTDLDGRGLLAPRGGKWTRATVRLIATNPANIGMRTHRGEIVGPGQWPSMFPDDEHVFHAACAVLAESERLNHRPTAVRWELSGLMTCGMLGDVDGVVCATRIYVKPVRRRNCYSCDSCSRASIDMEMADAYVTSLLLAWLEVPGRAAKVLAGADADESAQVDTLASISDLDRELQSARSLAERGELSAVGLSIVERRVLPALEQARALLRVAVPVPQLVQLLEAEDPRVAWAGMAEVSDRRAVIGAVMGIRLVSAGRGLRSPKWLPKRVLIEWKLGA